MIPITGAKLETFPLQQLHIVADLVYYDGPWLTLLEDDSKEIYYFYYWCSVDDHYNRWLVFRVTERQIKNYLTGQVSLREVILNPADRYYFLGDMDDDSEWQLVYLVMPDHLPKSYLPRREIPFDRELDGINEADWKILEQRFLTASSYHDDRVSKIEAVRCDTIEISNERLKQVSITTITGSFTNIGKKQPELKSSNKLSFVDKLGSVADFIKKLTTNDESVTNLITV